MIQQAALDFLEDAAATPSFEQTAKKSRRTGSFADNMKLPIHRWFRYSAGFSAEWAAEFIRTHKRSTECLVLDPFAGSGTALLAAESQRIRSVGIENHPFVYKVARAKLAWNSDPRQLLANGIELLQSAKNRVTAHEFAACSPDLLLKCYTSDALMKLQALKDEYLSRTSHHCEPVEELLWLVITSILRECSGVGTAQWQYVLPKKKKARVADPFVQFATRLTEFCADIESARRNGYLNDAKILLSDCRQLAALEEYSDAVTLVVTSPPYPNNYDYADATRIEMTFWGDVTSWSDLQPVVRHRLIRSCSQHSAAERLSLETVLRDDTLAPILKELEPVCAQLEEIRETKGGKKTYHTMVAAYFADLAKVWATLRTVCTKGAEVCFVIGDSAPYGVYVPVDVWLGKLALASGFTDVRFEKIRDRNIKWKNRKHTVPLKEGRLLVRG
ncbi:MAG: DNA methyltransferase [Gammaproteobacteria bacterium]